MGLDQHTATATGPHILQRVLHTCPALVPRGNPELVTIERIRPQHRSHALCPLA